MSDEDRSRFGAQARKEGMSLSAWLRAAAREHLERESQVARFQSSADVRAFFQRCRCSAGEPEPDWEQHLAVIDESRNRGLPRT